MFPTLTTRRPLTRSLRERVREAVGTALEFATLGAATLGPAAPSAPAPRCASRRSADRHRRGPEPHGAPLWEDGRAGRTSNASRAAAGSGGPSALGALAAAGRLVGEAPAG